MAQRAQGIDAHFQQALGFFRAGHPRDAELVLRNLLMMSPQHVHGLHLLGIIAHQSGRNDAAADLFTEAARHAPADVDLRWNLGTALHESGRTDEALGHFREALRIQPSNATLHFKLATVLRGLGQIEAAVRHYEEAAQLNPLDVATHHELGTAYKALGRVDAAVAELREAIRLEPANADMRHNLGMTLLLAGQWEEGWRELEWRWQAASFGQGRRLASFKRHDCAQPEWQGEALRGRTLLIHAEQGLGDTLQFCRFVPLLARENTVIFYAPHRLIRLLSSLEGVRDFVTPEQMLPPFDTYCGLMSLPSRLRTTQETLPRQTPYLAADPKDAARWKQRLSDYPGLRVGLTWAGNPTCTADKQRSVPLEKLAALADLPGVTLVSLQKHDVGAPEAGDMPALLDWTAELNDFGDTAALIEALDLVISVDTAVVHLAGALGKPVWLLNRVDPCWRWSLGRDDSVWYPTLRQFRQTDAGDWDGVIARVRKALRDAAGTRV